MDSLSDKSYIPIGNSSLLSNQLSMIPESKYEESGIYNLNEEIKSVPNESAPSQVNTNVMTINFEEIDKANHIATGDPVRCERCLSYLTKESKYDSHTRTWVCEFCNYPNILKLDEDELPHNSITTYVDPNQEEPGIMANLAQNSSDNTVIFCIDVSGSMSLTNDCTTRLKYMSHSGVISRLESVKLAVDEQLHKLSTTAPNTKVGLIIFSDNVVIIGDERQSDYELSCNLDNYEEILAISHSLSTKYITRPLSETLPELLKKLEEIDTRGSTALGPALLLSVGLISARGEIGSKVILCTDGEANTGIGQTNDYSSSEGPSFVYNKIGDLALNSGVIVSLVSLYEQDSRLDLLSPCAFKTGGNLVKIDPQNLSGDFSQFLEEKVIGFNCTIAVKLHCAMKFIPTSQADIGMDPSVLVKKLGNVFPTLTFSFEYTLKSPEELKEAKVNISKLKKLPFQALFSYTGLDKQRYCKVISKTLDVTNNASEAAKNINVNVLSVHSMRKTGELALQGRISEARGVTVSFRTLVSGNRDAENTYNRVVNPIETSVREETHTVAFNQGHRSDKLMACVTKTIKFNHK